MTRRWFLAYAALYASTFTLVEGTTSFALLHRLAKEQETPWVNRGELTMADGHNFTLLPTGDAGNLFLPTDVSVAVEADLRYEVAVAPLPVDGAPQVYQPSFKVDRPLCSLNPATYGPPILSDTLLLHVLPDGQHGLELAGMSWDQSRSCSGVGSLRVDAAAKALQRVERWKTKVETRPVAALSLPYLPAAPSSLAEAYLPDGTPKPPPPPEKGWFSRYGIYLLPVLVLLLLGGEDKPRPGTAAAR